MTRRTYVYVHLIGGPVVAGELTMIEDGRRGVQAIFRYDPDYLANPEAIPVDPVELPVQGISPDMTFTTAAGFDLFGGIRDAVPDDWGQSLLRRDSGRTDLALFDLLVAAGDERVGALAFGPDRAGPRRVAPWIARPESDGQASDIAFDLAEMVEAVSRFTSGDDVDRRLRRFVLRGSSLGGARPKGVTTWNGCPSIAKFGRDDDEAKGIGEACRIEYATMTLARRCGIDVPDVDLAVAADRDVYLIRRFDRIPLPTVGRPDAPPAGFWRRHFVSGLTMLAAHESEGHQQSYRALADRLRRLGTRPKDDCRQLYRRMIFNILCNNNDDHLRNHGFLYDGRQQWRLSPAYDLNASPDHGDETRRLALGVGRNSEGQVIRDANLAVSMTDCRAFYWARDEAVTLVAELVGVMKEWEVHFSACGVSRRTIARLSSAFLRVRQVQERGDLGQFKSAD
jgi:serine/threonine-protein kinase HipA